MSRIPAAVIAEVDARRAARCEVCGWPAPDVQYHHRRAYAMGGREADDPDQNTPVNLLGVHRGCHDRVHARPRISRDYGWIIPSWVPPAEWPGIRVLTDPSLRC